MASMSDARADPRSARATAVAIAKGLAILAVQAALTVAALFVLAFAVILASNAPYEDMLSVVGWVFWSALAAVVTTAAAMVVGLPIRLVPVLRRWWHANGEIALIGGAIGVILVIAAFLTGKPIADQGLLRTSVRGVHADRVAASLRVAAVWILLRARPVAEAMDSPGKADRFGLAEHSGWHAVSIKLASIFATAAGLAALLIGCSAPTTHESSNGHIIVVAGESTDARPQALAKGTADWGEAGCMEIHAEGIFLVMFPHGTTLDDNDVVTLPNGFSIRAGDNVSLGGGYSEPRTMNSDLSAIPDACLTDEIFVASGEVSQ